MILRSKSYSHFYKLNKLDLPKGKLYKDFNHNLMKYSIPYNSYAFRVFLGPRERKAGGTRFAKILEHKRNILPHGHQKTNCIYRLHDANELKTQKFNTKRSMYGINFEHKSWVFQIKGLTHHRASEMVCSRHLKADINRINTVHYTGMTISTPLLK